MVSASPSAKEAKEAWNQFLDGDRDKAPGDLVVDWLHRHTRAGLDVAKAGFARATERIGVMSAGKTFLDTGGGRTEDVILAKKIASTAVAVDSDIVQQLDHLVRLNNQEAAFATNLMKREDCQRVAEIYAHARDILGELTPDPPTWKTDVERDAGMIMQFRMAKANMGERLFGASASQASSGASGGKVAAAKLTKDSLMRELFKLHDLNGDGVLSEEELIKLNEKIAMLHYGKDTDKAVVRSHYKSLFRKGMNAEGNPVPYEIFAKYMNDVLDTMDRDAMAQEMILEQFIAEAQSARDAFKFMSFQSASDFPYLSKLGVVPTGSPARGTDGYNGADTTVAPATTASATTKLLPSRRFSKGDSIQVWSNSQKAWLDVVKFQVFDEETFAEGYAVPAGTHKVASKGGTKWVMPDQVPTQLRKKPA